MSEKGMIKINAVGRKKIKAGNKVLRSRNLMKVPSIVFEVLRIPTVQVHHK